MAYRMWRGVVGLINPTRRPGQTECLIRMMPQGVGVVPILLDIREGSLKEFHEALPFYERAVAELAEDGVDVIHSGGTPPFMLLGRKGETALIRKWEKKYKTPIFTAGQNQVAAMRALGIKRFVGASYSAIQNKIVVDYMAQAGFDIAEMAPLDVPFQQAGQISPEACYAHIKAMARRHKKIDGIYIQGSAWRTEGIVEALENDLGVPVVHANIAKAWEFQKRLGVNAPLPSLGRLYAELPAMIHGHD